MRWMVETAYSVFKRYFGESVSAKKWDCMVKEYQLIINPQ